MVLSSFFKMQDINQKIPKFNIMVLVKSKVRLKVFNYNGTAHKVRAWGKYYFSIMLGKKVAKFQKKPTKPIYQS